MDRSRNRAGGIFLILLGLALGAYGLPSSGDAGNQTRQPTTTTSAAGAVAPALPTRTGGAVDGRIRVPIVVTIASRADEAPLPSAQPPAMAPKDRGELVRELQRELRRVGCYDGDVNGAWTAPTRRAMQSFIDHVNAMLPVDEPDPVLHAMLGGQAGRVCGGPCQAETVRGEDGLCMPAAILARSVPGKPSLPAGAAQGEGRVGGRDGVSGGVAWRTTTKAVAAVPPRPDVAISKRGARRGPAPLEGRMALAGPGAEAPATIPAMVAPPRAPQAGPRQRRARTVARASRRAAMAHAAQRRPTPSGPLFPFRWLF